MTTGGGGWYVAPMNASGTPRTALFALVLAAACGKGLAQEVGSRKWFVQAQRAAKEAGIPTGFLVEMRTTTYANGTQADLAALEAEVAGRRDHPRWHEFSELSRRLANGGDVKTTRVWVFGRNAWRVSTDSPYLSEAEAWRDSALDGGDAWRLTPQTLVLMVPGSTETGYDPSTSIRQAEQSWKLLATTWVALVADWLIVDIQRDGLDWRATLRNPTGSREVALVGTFVEASAIFIQQVEFVRSDDPRVSLGVCAEFRNPDLDALIPRIIDGLVPARSIHQRAIPTVVGARTDELVTFEPFDQNQRSVLLAVPEPSGSDPIRSLAQLTGIVDKTSGRLIPVAGGAVDLGAAVDIPQTGFRQARDGNWLQVAVVACIVAVIGVLLWIRFGRRSA